MATSLVLLRGTGTTPRWKKDDQPAGAPSPWRWPSGALLGYDSGMLPSEPTWPVRLQIPVLWGDMDALGHVNNTVYLRWFEEARVTYFHRANLAIEGSVGIILAHQRCDYLAPVVYPDTIEVRVSVTKLGGASMTMRFSILSEKLGREAARGEGVIVAYDHATLKTIRVPEDVRDRLVTFEQPKAG